MAIKDREIEYREKEKRSRKRIHVIRDRDRWKEGERQGGRERGSA